MSEKTGKYHLLLAKAKVNLNQAKCISNDCYKKNLKMQRFRKSKQADPNYGKSQPFVKTSKNPSMLCYMGYLLALRQMEMDHIKATLSNCCCSLTLLILHIMCVNPPQGTHFFEKRSLHQKLL